MTSKSPPSLTQLFEAPEDMRGEAALVCGYSADVRFLDVALERFTRFTAAQRAIDGKVRLALVLDPSNPQIVPMAVPGMLHLGVREKRPRFGLLHAKVALLFFRPTDAKGLDTWKLRLVVSTGNWTHQTIAESIDLFWCIEIQSPDLVQPDDSIRQCAADIVAAWDFLAWVLVECCGHETNEPAATLVMIENLTRVVKRVRGVTVPESRSRFFDNRTDSLINEVVARVATARSTPKRNYLALGSGFFNDTLTGDNPGNDAFSTIEAIRGRFVSENLLTVKSTSLDLVVNRNACQGIAAVVDELRKKNWLLRDPSYLGKPTGRFLHAKFAFSALNQGGRAARPWLYLGSGNLTRQGFMSSAGAGNLEAGVVLHLGTLNWKSKGKHGYGPEDVGYVLPLQWDTELTPADGLQTGDELLPSQSVFLAPPVAYFQWITEETGGWLLPSELDGPAGDMIVIGLDGQPCQSANGRFNWGDAQPRQVSVRWNVTSEAVVPVIGSDGRIAAAAPRPCQIDELWGELEGFPEPPHVEEDDNGEDPDADPDSVASTSQFADRTTGTTLIRATMDLVERIAERQMQLPQSDWTAWLVRLEQTLMRAANTAEVENLRLLRVNPLSPLRAKEFRPLFAQGQAPELISYIEVLNRVDGAWNLDDLRSVGNLDAVE